MFQSLFLQQLIFRVEIVDLKSGENNESNIGIDEEEQAESATKTYASMKDRFGLLFHDESNVSTRI